MRLDTQYPSILDALGIMNTCFPRAEGRTKLFETEGGFRITVHDPYSRGESDIYALDIERDNNRIAFCIPDDEQQQCRRDQSACLMKDIAKIIGGTLFDRDSYYIDKRQTEAGSGAYTGDYRSELLKSIVERHMSAYATHLTAGISEDCDIGLMVGEVAKECIDPPLIKKARSASPEID